MLIHRIIDEFGKEWLVNIDRIEDGKIYHNGAYCIPSNTKYTLPDSFCSFNVAHKIELTDLKELPKTLSELKCGDRFRLVGTDDVCLKCVDIYSSYRYSYINSKHQICKTHVDYLVTLIKE